MSHKIAKLILEHASTFLEREEAVRTALSLGMPLHEIEEYLDWLDHVRSRPSDGHEEPLAGKEKPSEGSEKDDPQMK